MKRYTETIKLRVTPEMKTDLEMMSYRKGFGLSECVRNYLQKMIDSEGVPLPFQEDKPLGIYPRITVLKDHYGIGVYCDDKRLPTRYANLEITADTKPIVEIKMYADDVIVPDNQKTESED